MKCHVLVTVEMTFKDGRKLSVDFREHADAYVDAWNEPGIQPDRSWKAGTKMLLVVDGRIYKDVVGLVYIDKEGERIDALDGGSR